MTKINGLWIIIKPISKSFDLSFAGKSCNSINKKIIPLNALNRSGSILLEDLDISFYEDYYPTHEMKTRYQDIVAMLLHVSIFATPNTKFKPGSDVQKNGILGS